MLAACACNGELARLVTSANDPSAWWTGETRRLPLAAGLYVLSMRDTPGDRLQLAIVGASCESLAWQPAFFCSSRGDRAAIVYNPWRPKPPPELSGELTVRRIPDS